MSIAGRVIGLLIVIGVAFKFVTLYLFFLAIKFAFRRGCCCHQ